MSPDGRWRARVRADTRPVGYDSEPVTALSIVDIGSGETVVDRLLRQPDLLLVRFLAPRRLLLVTVAGDLYYEKDFDAGKERRFGDPREAADSYQPVTFDYETGRAGIVGLVMFGLAGAIALAGAVALLLEGNDTGVLGGVLGICFVVLAITARTYRAQQVVDPIRREVRDATRSALHARTATYSLDDFDRVQLCRGTNRGAPLFYLSLEGRQRLILLPRGRSPAPLVPIGERTARQLGLAFSDLGARTGSLPS